MRFSEHYINGRMAARGITLKQATAVVQNPVRSQLQEDGRTRYWGYVSELAHYLRVVVEPDGETIVTVFIDSGFQPYVGGTANGSS